MYQSEGADNSFIVPGCVAEVALRPTDSACCVVVVVAHDPPVTHPRPNPRPTPRPIRDPPRARSLTRIRNCRVL
eukprot:6083757-Pyramimonas_sp.AAC.1